MRSFNQIPDSADVGNAVILMLREYAGCVCRRHMELGSAGGPLGPLFAYFGEIEAGARRIIRLGTSGAASPTQDETAIFNILASAPNDKWVGDWTEFYARIDWIVRAKWHARIADRARTSRTALIEAGLPMIIRRQATPVPSQGRRICLVQ